jgi:hypothetical protein
MWQSIGCSIDYIYQRIGNEDIPTRAVISLTSVPLVYTANVRGGVALRRGRKPEEDVNFGFVFVSGDNPNTSLPPFRISYSYEEQNPVYIDKGSGTPEKSVTDTQYKPYDDQLKNEDDTAYVLSQMNTRAQSELDKVNISTKSARIKILGDETFDLKTMVEVDGELLDVIRVTHSFRGGFTTELELTNEKFRINIPPYQQKMRSSYDRTKLSNTQVMLDDLARKLQQQIDTKYVQQPGPPNPPQSYGALYSD